MATVPAEVHGPSDTALIDQVRHGSTDAYGELYQRHVAAAYNLARQLSRSASEADDLVSEAFAKVLDTLRAGKGPDTAFRAYLLTALRHTAYDRTRRDRKVDLAEDVTEMAPAEKVSVPFSDTAVAGLERSLAARAFASLPERWQAVLWHTEIEGQSPAEVGPLLGLSANGVSALAYRAREGLRQAYLQVHLAQTTEGRCRTTVDRLGAWTRGGLSKRETAQVEMHLDECGRCRALAAELADINGALRVVLAPLVLGAGAAGYLAATGGVAKLAAVGAAAGSAGGAGGAASAMGSAPRQFLGVAASAAALATAVAVGTLAHHGEQQLPAAQSPSVSGVPVPGAPPGQNPAAPPGQSPSASTSASPSASSPESTPPQPSPTSSAPGQPSLTATGPATPVTLTPGGDATLPLTVRNNGSGPSGPVSATLNLPPGVSAIGPASPHSASSTGPGTGGGHSGSGPFGQGFLFALVTTPADHVDCPGGTGKVTCSSPSGLEPGQSVTLVFRLHADNSVRSDATITGSVNGSNGVQVAVAVPMKVTKPGERQAVQIVVVREQFSWIYHPRLVVTVRNMGTTTAPVNIVAHTEASAGCSGCRDAEVTTPAMAPGEERTVVLEAFCYGGYQATLTATLGGATTSKTIFVSWWWGQPPASRPDGPTVVHGPPPTA